MLNEFSFFKGRRNPSTQQVAKLRELGEGLDFAAAEWFALGINAVNVGHCLFNRQIELKGRNMEFAFELGPKSDDRIEKMPEGPYFLRWHMPGEHSFMGHLDQGQAEVFYNCNLLMDEAIELFIDKLKVHLPAPALQLAPEAEMKALQQEERAREWLRVAFKVLSEAIQSTKGNPDLLLQARLWMGIDPSAVGEAGRAPTPVVRLICFNLDIVANFLPEGGMRVRVFDDQDKGHGTSEHARLDAVFQLRHREVFDQIIQLLSVLGRASKWPIPLAKLQ